MTWAYDISLACRVLIGTVFTVSVVTKVRGRPAWRSFSSWLTGLPLPALQPTWAPAVLTAAEAAVVVLVAIAATATAGLVAAAVLSLGLTLGLAAAVNRGARQPCHCFGLSSEPLSGQHVIRNTLLLTLAVTGSVAAITSGPAAANPVEGGLAAIGGLAAALLIIFSGDVTALLRPPSARLPGAVQIPRSAAR
jgi:Methylamine utilisation protein MauE